jgi:2-polyprenyl-3-methyl-5-hydroxy-6-metoxy-1,4-benzoquinol methylase
LRFLPDTRFVPVTELKQEGTFQIIFCLEVLEHVVELDKILDQLRYLLEPDGRLVISVPVEMGVTLAIKQAARRLTAWRGNRDYAETERYTLGEFLCGLMGGKVLRPIYTDPAGFRYHGHKGFDWRELRRALNAQFELVEESVTPLPWLPSQHWLVLKPR